MNLLKYSVEHIEPHKGSQIHHIPGRTEHRGIAQFQIL